MTVYEAILRGAACRPQAFGAIVRVDPDGGERTCVLGAMYEGETGQRPFGYLRSKRDLVERFPDLAVPVTLPCDCPSNEIQMIHAMVHLNDAHRWSREAIADWAATIIGGAERRAA